MRRTARVLAVGRGRVRLLLDDIPGCAGPAGRAGCSRPWFAARPVETLEVDAAGASLAAGDRVELTLGDRALLRLAAAAYLPPTLGLVAGPLLMRGLGVPGELPALLAALAGLAAGGLVARRLVRRPGRPALTRIGADAR